MRLTFHLVSADAWATHDRAAPYEAPSLASEGFIHCTDGEAGLIATANRYYRTEPGAFVALLIDLDRLDVPWRYDDAAGTFPHVYGAIPVAAIADVRSVVRADDGTFVRVTERGVDRGHPTVRGYRPGDGVALRALWTTVGFRLLADDDPGLDRFAGRNPGLFLVAERGDAIVGSAMGGWDGRRGWLYHVATHPDDRGRGIASELVARVEEGLAELGCQRVNVIVEEANTDALAFWQRRGYAPRTTRQLGKDLAPAVARHDGVTPDGRVR